MVSILETENRCSKCTCELNWMIQGVPLFIPPPNEKEGPPFRGIFVLERPTVEERDVGMAGVGVEYDSLVAACEYYKIPLHQIYMTFAQRCATKKLLVSQGRPCINENLLPFIAEQKPEFVAAFGGKVLQLLTGKTGITKHNGTVEEIDYKGVKIPTVFSVKPSYAANATFNNKVEAENMFDTSFKVIRNLYENRGKYKESELKVPTERDFIIEWSDVKRLEKYLSKHDFYMFDWESYPLKPWYEDSVILSAAWTVRPHEAVAIPLDHPQSPWTKKERNYIFDMLRVWARSNVKKAAANAKHEILWTREVLGVELENVVCDPIVLDYLHDENQSHDVKTMAWRFTDMGGYDSDMEEYWYKQEAGIFKGKTIPDYRKAPLDKLLPYNADDTDVEYQCMEKLLGMIDPKLKRVHDEVQLPAAYMLASIEKWGWSVDVDAAVELFEDYNGKIADKLKEFKEFPEFVQFEKDQGADFNFDSYKQKLKLIYGYDPDAKKKFPEGERYFEFEIDPFFITKSGNPSTDKNWRNSKKGTHPFIMTFHDYLTLWSIKKNFLNRLPDYLDCVDGRVHTDYNASKVVSGRLSSTNPNTQNYPREKAFWRIFNSRWPNGSFGKADYSQFELRILAWLANDLPMIETFRTGKDIHTETTKEIFLFSEDDWLELSEKKQVEKRQFGKRVNFGIANDQGAFHLSVALTALQRQTTGNWEHEVKKEEAQKMINNWYKPHKAILDWKAAEIAKASKLGYVETPIGYRRRSPYVLPEYKMSYDFDPAKVKAGARALISFLMQSTAGVMMLIAKILIWEELRKQKMDSVLCGSVYDSIIFDSPPDEAYDMCALVNRVMMSMGDRYNCTVPLKVDVESGPNGAELEEWEELPF